MPIYLYWGEDEFAIAQAVAALRQRVLDSDWSSFNFDKISPDQPDAVLQGLNQAMTPPFGTGSRLVWLVNTTLCQRCPEDLLAEVERTLPAIPEHSVLLLTSSSKPDGRLKSTKLLQKHAQIQEFSVIPPWKTELLVKQVRQVAQVVGVKLTETATELLAESVGNDTRQLYSELEKLRLFAGDSKKPIDQGAIATLVTTSTQSAFQLGAAIRQGETAEALDLITALLRQNEPALRIVSSLISQFRRWTWVKTMVEAGERDEREIAKAAEIDNPKRLYFLKQEVQSLSLPTLLQTLSILLELDASLKRGADELATLQIKVIELCELCRL
ncbi:DNA polymerase III subunit delta [Kovacikia minuta CCNUW1]|uniref:DNA polymerase III subunit delta n=1 Tax=Kovacikia minuta TaxID=2931930 RepID=UPI001CCE9FCF|nr:DNA polymerase III subunit delta [Kovacikia minuta]UBF24060.1 DNA polymerase III subunit delta [Kovacikia minuta CCNUW1]